MSANSSEIVSDFEVISRSERPQLDDDVEIVCQELEAKLVVSNDETNFLALQEVRKMYKLMQKHAEDVMEENKNLIRMIDELNSENEKLEKRIEMEREDAQDELDHVINKERAKRNDWMIEKHRRDTEVRDLKEEVRNLKEQLGEFQQLKNQIEDARHIESALLGSVRKMKRDMDKMKLRAEKAEEKCAELSNALEEKITAADLEMLTLFEEHKMKTEELQTLVLSLTKSCDQKDRTIAKFEKAAEKCECSEENMEVPINHSMAKFNGVWKFVMTSNPEEFYNEENRNIVERSLMIYNVSERKHTTTTVYEGQIIHQTESKIGKKIRISPDWTTRAYVRNGGLFVVDKYSDDSDTKLESRTEFRVFDDFLRIRSKTKGLERIEFYKRV